VKRRLGLPDMMILVALVATIAVVLVEIRTRDLDEGSVRAFR
jgi:hypothetical protein